MKRPYYARKMLNGKWGVYAGAKAPIAECSTREWARLIAKHLNDEDEIQRPRRAFRIGALDDRDNTPFFETWNPR